MLKKFLGQSTIYMAGSIIGMMASFISFPIFTRVFSTSEYGLFSMVTLSIYLALAIAKCGMQHSAVRFFDEFRLQKRGQSFQVYYSTLFWGSFFAAVMAAGFFIMVSHIFPTLFFKSDDYNVFWIVGGLIITEAVFVRIGNFLRIEQRVKPFVALTVTQTYGQIAVGTIFLFLVSKTVQGFLMGTLFLNILVLLVSILILFKKEDFKLVHFSYSFLKENIVYGYPLISFELSSFMIKFIDRYMIQFFDGMSDVGIYSAAGNLAMGVSTGIFSSAWLAVSPIFMQIWSEHGDKRTQEFLSHTIKMLTLVSVPLIFGLAAISQDVMVVFATTKFRAAAPTLPYLTAGAVLWGFCPILAAGLFIHKQTKKLNRIVLIGAAINIGLNLIMIPKWGIMGASVATFITYIIVAILTVNKSYQYLKVKIDLIPTAQVIFSASCMYFLLIVIPLNITLYNLIFKIALGVASYSLLLFLLSKEIREIGIKVLPVLLKPVISKMTNRG